MARDEATDGWAKLRLALWVAAVWTVLAALVETLIVVSRWRKVGA
ncbi:MAG: hypothetical protein ABI400_08315 [Lacisediminihabitans sp.]